MITIEQHHFNMVKFEKALFVFNFKMKSFPAQFTNYFRETSSVYERSTRASTHNKYFLPCKKIKTSKFFSNIKAL